MSGDRSRRPRFVDPQFLVIVGAIAVFGVVALGLWMAGERERREGTPEEKARRHSEERLRQEVPALREQAKALKRELRAMQKKYAPKEDQVGPGHWMSHDRFLGTDFPERGTYSDKLAKLREVVIGHNVKQRELGDSLEITDNLDLDDG